MTKTTKSRLMTIANKLVGKGYNRRTAMLKAWVIAKAERLSVRIAGTSFNRRQSVLKAMESKPAVLKLKHESTNAADRNAVSLWAFPEGARALPNWLSTEICRLCYSPSAGQGRNSQP